MTREIDLFIVTGEASGDLHGAHLVQELRAIIPSLCIEAIAGPHMRALAVPSFFPMEQLQVMGFVDVVRVLPHLIQHLFLLRRHLLALRPKAIVLIDYPGFNLRLARLLRKGGFTGKLYHFICPSVWAWGKRRIPQMAQTLDALFALFPFEKKCFAHTSFPVHLMTHPLLEAIPLPTHSRRSCLALFPGSRMAEIQKNLPLQCAVAKRLQEEDPSLEVALSVAHHDHKGQIQTIVGSLPVTYVAPDETYALMRRAKMALATSGTVTLELALHETPTVVHYAITSIDCFLAQKIFRIDLPFYCLVNLIAQQEIFPELFGPHLTEETLHRTSTLLWHDPLKQRALQEQCRALRTTLASVGQRAAPLLLQNISFIG